MSSMSAESCFRNVSLVGPENIAFDFAPTLNVTALKFSAVALPRVAAGAYDDTEIPLA